MPPNIENSFPNSAFASNLAALFPFTPQTPPWYSTILGRKEYQVCPLLNTLIFISLCPSLFYSFLVYIHASLNILDAKHYQCFQVITMTNIYFFSNIFILSQSADTCILSKNESKNKARSFNKYLLDTCSNQALL